MSKRSLVEGAWATAEEGEALRFESLRYLTSSWRGSRHPGKRKEVGRCQLVPFQLIEANFLTNVLPTKVSDAADWK